MGAKYESCLSETSDGVGEGEMTLGVDGIGYGKDVFIAATMMVAVGRCCDGGVLSK